MRSCRGANRNLETLGRFGVESTVRPSLSFYNTAGEIDRLVKAIRRIQLPP